MTKTPQRVVPFSPLAASFRVRYWADYITIMSALEFATGTTALHLVDLGQQDKPPPIGAKHQPILFHWPDRMGFAAGTDAARSRHTFEQAPPDALASPSIVAVIERGARPIRG